MRNVAFYVNVVISKRRAESVRSALRSHAASEETLGTDLEMFVLNVSYGDNFYQTFTSDVLTCRQSVSKVRSDRKHEVLR